MDKFLIYNGFIVWVMNKFKIINKCLEIEEIVFESLKVGFWLCYWEIEM